MLYTLLIQYSDVFSPLNVFRYITFRSGLAVITSLLTCFWIGMPLIRRLKILQNEGQPIREDGPETHFSKKGTPTMGGVMILFSVLVSVLLWVDLFNPFVIAALLVMFSFGVLGFIDDYMKIRFKNSKGVSGRVKLLWQFLISILALLIIYYATPQEHATTLSFPFFKSFVVDLGLFYFVFAMIVITGASNAVNLTDGLDGLAIGPVMIATACFGMISYVVGNAVFANYLHITNISGTGEITVICAALIGAGLGFLWYNAPPAQIFMGDVGSLALGGFLGVVSVIIKHEIVLAIIGGLFVIEALSVIIQVVSFKTRGKRVFKMAPLHHHFEKIGWSETKVVMRFWILAVIFALIGLATLKLR
ncbi:MAG: phospho-N-acetylmuramoyl-pentapeptide-transferase [Alphaproteobacteria bacterium]|jgi:phospho-N-acetylmuramoyl-pentapeptide-transferase|nr:phospho-N-acetylmuramoyl-pentapeptide-transferase [Candidatus Jidaibacter sp.]